MRRKYSFKNLFLGALIGVGIILNSYGFVQAKTPLEEAKYVIESCYVDKVSKDVINSSTISDMVKKLNDPFSSYFTAEQYNDFLNSIDNKFVGIGIYLEVVDSGIKVTSVIDNSSAKEAGILPGDIIISADGHSLSKMVSEEATSYIKGKEGTSVNLVIDRNGEKISKTVYRKTVEIPTVKGEILDNEIGYINISSFGQDTANLFTNVLEDLNESNPKMYIIDLRFNGGGYMGAALDIAGHFIGKNPAIIVKNRNDEKQKINAYNYKQIDKPVIFLINEYTASASEILSAAVKDYNKAIFIGENSYGKGVAQQMFRLVDGSVLKITTQRFYSPLGNEIHKKGISPDVLVKEEYTDSLFVARLLTYKENQALNSNECEIGNYVIKINEDYYKIPISKVREKGLFKAFKSLVKGVDKSNVYVGTEKGFKNISEDIINNDLKLFYPDFAEGKRVSKNLKDNVIKVKFNRELDKSTVNNNSIFVVKDSNGKIEEAKINFINSKVITLTLNKCINKGDKFYIVIDKKVKDLEGKCIKDKTALEVSY
ncbi:carboxy-terminal processing protease CtpB precursor [Clostridium acetireducens DSM 10703]|uniref:Carboxy-terminal processing protease CtpB n=1 Tax=Clostridium acetireducens DSM 10703 TaxID=1121290 RepID=A0A1E8F1E0_9CLOT|nr:S41 family peptidase [Clostridium acetireducens]OFI07240.1 carboxy-terminal processing protease CtpB precursor [Clostridium acetireducens DSM 10703]